VIGDCVFKRSVKNILFLGFLDSFSSFIVLISLIFYHLTNVRDIFKDYCYGPRDSGSISNKTIETGTQ
jgi:hypothetical protein